MPRTRARTVRTDPSEKQESALDEWVTLPFQRLLSIARQSGIVEPSRCAVTIGLLSTSRVVRHGLQRMMKPLGLSEARFFSLVTLYVLDPAPSTPANLAYHVEVTRAAMTDTLDQMQKLGWIQRQRLTVDRRVIHIHLTAAGREKAAESIECFLKIAAEMGELLTPTHHRAFDAVCCKLRDHALSIRP